MKEIIGIADASDKNIVIITSNYNSDIVAMLFDGAIDAFCHFSGNLSNITKIEVPGAFEIPGTIHQVIKHIKADAILSLGAVIKGGTPHFDYVAGETSGGISRLSQSNDIPIIFGILTTNDFNEALERASTKAGNKGWELMETTLQTISIYNQIEKNKK